MKATKKKKVIFSVLSFLSSFSPVAVYVGLNWDRYVKDVPAGSLRLTVGGLMVAGVVVMKVLGKLNITASLKWYAIAAVICYALQALLSDLCIIFLLAASGEAVDSLFFSRWLKEMREDKKTDDLAEQIAEKMRSITEEHKE